MKKSILFVLIVIAITFDASGQIDSAVMKLYDSWYFFNSPQKNKVKVYTYEFEDSTVTILARNAYFKGTLPASNDLQIIPVPDINKIVFRRKGKQTGFLIGGIVAGGLIGGLIGLSNGDDPGAIGVPAGVKALTGALIGAGIGVGIALPIGSIKKSVHIDGNTERYKQIRPELLKYSIRYYQHKTPLKIN